VRRSKRSFAAAAWASLKSDRSGRKSILPAASLRLGFSGDLNQRPAVLNQTGGAPSTPAFSGKSVSFVENREIEDLRLLPDISLWSLNCTEPGNRSRGEFLRLLGRFSSIRKRTARRASASSPRGAAHRPGELGSSFSGRRRRRVTSPTLPKLLCFHNPHC